MYKNQTKTKNQPMNPSPLTLNESYGSYPDENHDDDCEKSDYVSGLDEGYREALRQKASTQKRDAKGKFIKVG